MRVPKFILWIIGFIRYIFSPKEVKTEMLRNADASIDATRREEVKQETGKAEPKFWYFKKGYMANRFKRDTKRIFVKQWVSSNADFFRYMKRKKSA